MKKTISILAIIAMLIFVLATSVNATLSESANVSISGDKEQYTKGDTASVTVDTGTPVDAADFKITYDSTSLRYTGTSVTGAQVNSNTDGEIIVAWYTTDNKVQSFTFNFETIAEGSALVTVTPTTLGADEEEVNNLKAASTTLTIVKAPEATPGTTETPAPETTPTANTGKKPTSYPKTGLNTTYIYVAGIVLVAICGAVIVNKRMK